MKVFEVSGPANRVIGSRPTANAYCSVYFYFRFNAKCSVFYIRTIQKGNFGHKKRMKPLCIHSNSILLLIFKLPSILQ